MNLGVSVLLSTTRNSAILSDNPAKPHLVALEKHDLSTLMAKVDGEIFTLIL
jgi:hypothetical protein